MWRRITGLVLDVSRLNGEIADMSCCCADTSVADRLAHIPTFILSREKVKHGMCQTPSYCGVLYGLMIIFQYRLSMSCDPSRLI